MRNKILNKTKGFTLIEIMLVIGIVTLLASIAMFGMTEAKKKAQDTKMIAETKQVETAISLYQASDENEYVPFDTTVVDSSVTDLHQEDSTNTDSDYAKMLQPLVAKGYLPSIPKSPDGKSYFYGVSPSKKSGVFVAKLKSSNNSNNGGGGSTIHCVEVGGGSDNLCSQIPQAPEEEPEVTDPYTYEVAVNGYKEIELIPNETYTFVYEDNGSDLNFKINGTNVIHTWIAGDDLIVISESVDWNCDLDGYGSCWGSEEDSFEFMSFDKETLTLKVKYYPSTGN